MYRKTQNALRIDMFTVKCPIRKCDASVDIILFRVEYHYRRSFKSTRSLFVAHSVVFRQRVCVVHNINNLGFLICYSDLW